MNRNQKRGEIMTENKESQVSLPQDEEEIMPDLNSALEETIKNEHTIRLEYEGKEIILIGTAHVSKESAEEVRQIIEREQPDTVCIELDDVRFESMQNKDKYQNTDIVQIIRNKKVLSMMANLVLASFQKKMADQLGIQPGSEMMQGIASAREIGAELVMADRDIQTTLNRVWRSVGFAGKIKLMTQLVLSVFDDEEITEEELSELKELDALDKMLDELAELFPALKRTLIDERDMYLSEKIKHAPGQKIIAVLGAGHLPGISREIENEHDLKTLEVIPEKTTGSKILPGLIPAAILALILYGFTRGQATGWEQVKTWILWNGSFSALGTALAFGHPLSILTAFVVAPISSLNPFLAAGWFAGLMEARMRKPSVADFQNLGTDATSVRGFWRNKVTRVLLVVIFANVGSTIGTIVGGMDIFQNLF
jgi:pheromone shutdown-related protein TraB